MKAREFCFSLITIVTFFCSFARSNAEDQVNLEPMRIGDPTLEVSSLELMLDPLTAEELEVIAVSWRDSLKQTIQQISELSLKAGELSEDDKKKRDDLVEEKNKLLILFRKVISELETKGGEIRTFRAYADAVAGAQIAVSKDGSLWSKSISYTHLTLPTSDLV